MTATVEKNAHVWERDGLEFDHRRALEIGAAGEHMVCADLLLQGHRAFQAAQGSTYDVVVDVAGRLIRIAVKSTVKARPRISRPGSRSVYRFSIGRASRVKAGKYRQRAYEVADVDVVAMVALDSRRIAYSPLNTCPTALYFETEEPSDRTSLFGPKTQSIRRFADFSFRQTLAYLGVENA